MITADSLSQRLRRDQREDSTRLDTPRGEIEALIFAGLNRNDGAERATSSMIIPAPGDVYRRRSVTRRGGMQPPCVPQFSRRNRKEFYGNRRVFSAARSETRRYLPHSLAIMTNDEGERAKEK